VSDQTDPGPAGPSRRELLGGLVILIVCGGVALSRGGLPRAGVAVPAPSSVETTPEAVTEDPEPGARETDDEEETDRKDG
jgi:hypothetical protein